MPTVRMLTSVADGDESFSPSDGEIELDGDRASAWSAAGMCEIVRARPPETPEGRGARPERPGPGRRPNRR